MKRTVGGLTGKFLRMAKLYKQFAEGWEEAELDFSDQALVDLFNNESFGEPVDERKNGYAVGKHWMDVTIAMWKEEQKSGAFSVLELYQDPRLPNWWLDRIFVGKRQILEEHGFTFTKDEA